MTEATWDYRDQREYLRRAFRAEWPPLIVTVAITGGLQGKEATPNLPETPEEQAQQTYECYQAGASIVHIHARDASNGYADTSSSADTFRQVEGMIRDKCPDIIVNITTGASFGMPMETRLKLLDADPEMATLNTGPNPVRFAFKKRMPPLTGRDKDYVYEGLDLNTPSAWSETELFAKTMMEKNVKPEIEMYHEGHYWIVDNLVRQNLLTKPYFIQFVMGSQGGAQAAPKTLFSLLDNAPQPAVINVAGVGGYQLPLNTMAILLGLHARTGIEDNVYYKRGELAKSNAQLVERVVRVAKELNREVATPAQARQMLGMSAHPKKW